MEYNVDYFIKKSEAIPEDRWAVGHFVAGDASCAQGHCGVRIDQWDNAAQERYFKNIDMFPEAASLIRLFQPNYYDTGVVVAKINNGAHPDYRQPTPKQRILAALYEIKKPSTKRKRVAPDTRPSIF